MFMATACMPLISDSVVSVTAGTMTSRTSRHRAIRPRAESLPKRPSPLRRVAALKFGVTGVEIEENVAPPRRLPLFAPEDARPAESTVTTYSSPPASPSRDPAETPPSRRPSQQLREAIQRRRVALASASTAAMAAAASRSLRARMPRSASRRGVVCSASPLSTPSADGARVFPSTPLSVVQPSITAISDQSSTIIASRVDFLQQNSACWLPGWAEISASDIRVYRCSSPLWDLEVMPQFERMRLLDLVCVLEIASLVNFGRPSTSPSVNNATQSTSYTKASRRMTMAPQPSENIILISTISHGVQFGFEYNYDEDGERNAHVQDTEENSESDGECDDENMHRGEGSCILLRLESSYLVDLWLKALCCAEYALGNSLIPPFSETTPSNSGGFDLDFNHSYKFLAAADSEDNSVEVRGKANSATVCSERNQSKESNGFPLR